VKVTFKVEGKTLEHDWSAWKPASGLYTWIRTCSRCGKKLYSNSTTQPDEKCYENYIVETKTETKDETENKEDAKEEVKKEADAE
jgi:hypothetical protein